MITESKKKKHFYSSIVNMVVYLHLTYYIYVKEIISPLDCKRSIPIIYGDVYIRNGNICVARDGINMTKIK